MKQDQRKAILWSAVFLVIGLTVVAFLVLPEQIRSYRVRSMNPIKTKGEFEVFKRDIDSQSLLVGASSKELRRLFPGMTYAHEYPTNSYRAEVANYMKNDADLIIFVDPPSFDSMPVADEADQSGFCAILVKDRIVKFRWAKG